MRNLDQDFDRWLRSGLVKPAIIVEVQPFGEGIPRESDLTVRLEMRDRAAPLADSSESGDYESVFEGPNITYRSNGRVDTKSAIDFDGGADSRIELPGIDFDEAGFSVSLGIKPDSAAGTQDLFGVFDVGAGTDADTDRLQLYMVGGNPRAAMRNTAGTSSTASISIGVWSHLAWTLSRAAFDTNVGFFFDGRDISASTSQIVGQTLGSVPTLLPVIGGDSDVGGSTFSNRYAGLMDHLYVWARRALSCSEQHQLHRWLYSNRFRASRSEVEIDGMGRSVVSISPITAKFDIEKNRFDIADLEIVLARDGWWSGLESRYSLKDAIVRVKLGDERMAACDFETIYNGALDEAFEQDGFHVLSVRDRSQGILETPVTGHWEGCHPFEATIGILEAAGGSELNYEADSLDPSASGYETMSHWGVSRTGKRGGVIGVGASPTSALISFSREVDTPVPAGKLIESLMQALPGGLVPREATGKLFFKKHDLTEAASASWAKECIKNLQIQTLFGNLRNSARLEIHPPGAEVDGQKFWSWWEYPEQPKDAIVIDLRSAMSCSRLGVKQEPLASDWFASALFTGTPDGPSSGWQRDVDIPLVGISPFYAGVSGFTLAEDQRVIGGTQESWRELSAAAGRYLYLVAGDPDIDLMSCIQVASMTFGWASWMSDHYSGLWPTGNANAGATTSNLYMHLGTDGQFGTGLLPAPPAAGYDLWKNQYLYDVTIGIATASYQLQRFGYGCPILNVETDLEPIANELLDVVSLEWPAVHFTYEGLDPDLGIQSHLRWQVTQKRIDICAKPPGISWELAQLPAPSDFKLKAFYRLNEASGQLLDASGNGYHSAAASMVGAGVTYRNPGPIDYALDFNGNDTNAWADLGDFGLEDTWTIGIWVKADSISDVPAIWGKATDPAVSGINGNLHNCWINATGTLTFDFLKETENFGAAGTVVTGKWHLIVLAGRPVGSGTHVDWFVYRKCHGLVANGTMTSFSKTISNSGYAFTGAGSKRWVIGNEFDAARSDGIDGQIAEPWWLSGRALKLGLVENVFDSYMAGFRPRWLDLPFELGSGVSRLPKAMPTTGMLGGATSYKIDPAGFGTTITGLSVGVAPGAMSSGITTTVLGGSTVELAASSENWVYINHQTHRIEVISNSLGSSAPADMPWWLILIYQFTTDATDVVDTNDFTITKALDGSQLADESVTEDAIAEDAITNAKLADDAVDTAELADNAVTASKIAAAVAGDGLSGGGGSALAVNVDGSTLEISTDAVRVKDAGIATAKIADAAVTDAKIIRRARGTASTTNATPTNVTTAPAITIPSNTAFAIDFNIIAKKDDNTTVAKLLVSVLAHRAGGGAVVDSVSILSNQGGTAWTAGAVASGNDVLPQVTGAAATNITWAVRAEWEEA